MRIVYGIALVMGCAGLCSCSSQSDPPPRPTTYSAPSPGGNFSLTIYSTADPATFAPMGLLAQRRANFYDPGGGMAGYGVVRESRRIRLNAGENQVAFENVAAGIDPTTVAFKSLTAPDSTAVIEQNFEYDVASATKLLEKYLGKEVQVTLKPSPENAAAAQSFRGKLLACGQSGFPSYGGNEDLVFQTADSESPIRIQRYDTISAIRLADAGGGLVIKPTLRWKIDARQSGAHDVQVAYQTDGLTWRADYSLLLSKDESAADLSAWVTVVNNSGMGYPDAALKLVAGGVQRLKPEQTSGGYGGFGMGGMSSQTGFAERSFFEYHLYTLGRRTTLPENSTKQIELFPQRSRIPVTKTYVYYGLPASERYLFFANPPGDRDLGNKSNKEVDIYLQTRNTEKNGLGIALPAGRVRVYKVDEADSSREFIGEDIIRHTPKDEEILVRLGTAFDLVGERRQTNSHEEPHVYIESFEITLRNHKTQPVTIIVKENLFRWLNWEITECSDKWQKQDHRTIHVPVEVPAGGEKKVTYTVKYTW